MNTIYKQVPFIKGMSIAIGNYHLVKLQKNTRKQIFIWNRVYLLVGLFTQCTVYLDRSTAYTSQFITIHMV